MKQNHTTKEYLFKTKAEQDWNFCKNVYMPCLNLELHSWALYLHFCNNAASEGQAVLINTFPPEEVLNLGQSMQKFHTHGYC